MKTFVEMGWGGKKNGQLLALAAQGFDALITVDKNLPYQQNRATLPVAVVIDSYSNELAALLPLVPALEVVLAAPSPRTFARVGGGPGPVESPLPE
ncbi:MAG: hypothetical protein ACSLE9_07400 [Burkholderiaceae bacterium]